MKVSYSNGIVKLFTDLGVFNSVFLSELSEKVQTLPRGDSDFDASDDAIMVSGNPISFARYWNRGEIMIMTNDEAICLDIHATF